MLNCVKMLKFLSFLIEGGVLLWSCFYYYFYYLIIVFLVIFKLKKKKENSCNKLSVFWFMLFVIVLFRWYYLGFIVRDII